MGYMENYLSTMNRYQKGISPFVYPGEQWVKLTEFNIAPYYWVSTYGRFYSERVDRLMGFSVNKKGYLQVPLFCKDNIRHTFKCHRLVLGTFNPHPDMYDEYIIDVNHKNGVKWDNRLINLEWATRKENIEHAITNNLRKIGEDAPNAIYTKDQILKVCKMIEDNASEYEIALTVFNRPLDLKIHSLISSILYDENWRAESHQFNINYKHKSTVTLAKENMLTYEQMHEACKMKVENPKISYDEVMHALGIFPSTVKERHNYRDALYNLFRGHTYKAIGKLYGFC